MMYVPEFVVLYEIVPYIQYVPLNNETIRVVVKYYLEGGETRNAIIKKYGPIRDWNTSDVTDMSYLFSDYNYFNQPIGEWDVSSVTNMEGMFYGVDNFNQPIGEWDVSSVTSMKSMFCFTSFNQNIGEWDTSSVTNMECMFYWGNLNPENAPWCNTMNDEPEMIYF